MQGRKVAPLPRRAGRALRRHLARDVLDHGEEAYTEGDGAILVKPKEVPLAQGATNVVPVGTGGRL